MIAAGFAWLAIAAAGCTRPREVGSYPSATRANGLPDVTLVDERGNAVALASLKGTPVLVDFIYTRCTSSCPMLTMKMSRVARLLDAGLGAKIRIVSITVDPEHDNPAALLAYARSHGADLRGWMFLTGTPGQIGKVLSAYNLRIAREPDGSITHVTEIFLLGARGRQERFYDGLKVQPATIARDAERMDNQG